MTSLPEFESSWREKYDHLAAENKEEHKLVEIASEKVYDYRLRYYSLYFDKYLNNYQREQKILDIGCGIGTICSRIAKSCGCSVYGVDYSAEMIKEAKKRSPSGVVYKQADCYGLPLPDSAFDVVICFEVFQYLNEPTRAVAEIKRVLKPGGLLLFATLNRSSLTSVFKRCLGMKESLKRYSPFRFTKFLKEEGFLNVKIHGFYLFPDKVSFLNKFFLIPAINRFADKLFLFFNCLSNSFLVKCNLR